MSDPRFTKPVMEGQAVEGVSQDHAELARLAEAASGDEWITFISGRPEYRNVVHYIERNPPCDHPFIAEVQTEEDAAFLAAANPARVLALLAEIAALRGRENELIAAHAVAVERIGRQRDELWKVVRDRREIYRKKRDQRSPFGADTLTPWDSFNTVVEAFDILESEINASMEPKT